MFTRSKTDVRKYASGWVVTHPGETRCDFERAFSSHGEAVEFATNHALACLHTLERRRMEDRLLRAQAIENADLYGPSAHRDVVRVPARALGPARGGIITNPKPIDLSWDEIVRATGPIRYDAPDLPAQLRSLGARIGSRFPRLSVAR